MRSILVTCSIIGLMFLAWVPGCSHGSGPTAPDATEHGVQSFNDCAEVFPGTPLEPYRDLDIATLVDIITGIPSTLEIDLEDTGLSIMVSCLHSPGLEGDQPFLVWLKDDGLPLEKMPFGFPGGDSLEYKFPKVDAIYRPGMDPAHSHVIVAVSFMFRPLPDGIWQLGVIFLHWSGAAFLDGQPGPPDAVDLVFPPDVTLSAKWGHDIAFNPQYGDAYLVYTTDTGAIQKPWRLMYHHLIQPTPQFEWETVPDGPWWAVDPAFIANCWLPSIDIGRLVLPPEYPVPCWILGIAFTAKMQGVDVYRVAGNYWCPDIDGDQDQEDNEYFLVNPYVEPERDAGLPCFDISPNNVTLPPYYAIAFVQSVFVPLDNHQYEVWVADNINNDPLRIERTGVNSYQKTLPSIACHYTYAGDKAVSVSMYEHIDSGAPTGNYWPVAVKVEITPALAVDQTTWTPVQIGYTPIPGPWGPFDVTGQDAGIATDIEVTDDNSYYIGFSDRMDASATSVYAAWGNTN